MTEEGEVGPVEISGEGMELLPLIRFIPEKGGFESGFVIKNEQQIEIGYISEDDRFFGVASEQGVLDFDNGQSNQMNYVAETIAQTGPYLALVNLQPSSQPPSPWHLNIFEFDHQLLLSLPLEVPDDPFGTDLDWMIENDLPPLSISAIAGVHIAPDPDPSKERIYILAQDTGTLTTFHEIQYELRNFDPGLFAAVEVRPVFTATLVDTPLNTFYFHYPFEGVNGTSVAQYRYGGVWKTLKWDDLDLVAIDIPHAIDALLTTGQLFCQEGETVYVYDLEGVLMHELNMGDLQFAYEWWDGGKYRMIFVLPYYVDFGEEKGFMFKIFSMPTDDLADLD